MAEMMEYKCPNCEGGLYFDSSLQKLKCPYCDSVFDIDQFKQKEEAFFSGQEKQKTDTKQQADWDDTWQRDAANKAQNNTYGWSDEELNGMKMYSCQSCGAEIITEETTGASTCPYCGNPVVMKDSFAGTLRPDYVIPFRLKKEDALKRLTEHFKNKKLLPPVFKDQHHLEEVKGIYVPYWLFNTQAKADMLYEGRKLTRTWRRGDYRYEEYSFFHIGRKGEMKFSYVPVDGAKKMDDAMMESLEPYDMKDAVDFKTAYLAGYLADRYDVSKEECLIRAKERSRESVDYMMRGTVGAYDSVRQLSGNINVQQSSVKYALFPVWLLNTTWNGQIYTFAMNGQTGKFIGDLPVDKGLFWKNLITRTLLYGAIITLGAFWMLFS